MLTRTLIGLALLLVMAPLQALTVDRLYEAEVTVAGQQAAEREAALQLALGQVLVRMTGQGETLTQPATQAILQAASQYLQQFRYLQPATPDDPAAPLRLWARFDHVALAAALRRAGLPVWGDERPQTLVWLAVDAGGQRRMVSEGTTDPVAEALQAAARRRGIPLLLPLMDLEDRGQVDFQDIWGGFLDRVERASARYAPPAILVGRLNGATGRWSARWTLFLQGQTRNWEDRADTVDALMRGGVGLLADELGSRFALQGEGGGQGRLRLRVEGIASLADYAQVRHYLGSLSQVRSVQVREVAGERMDFMLEVAGDAARLEQAIRLGDRLRPTGPVPGETPDPAIQGHYRLRP